MTLRLALSVLVLSCAVLVQGLPDAVYQSEFTSWMAKHKKSYSTAEFATKFATFKKHYDFIQTHNAGGYSYQVGLNAVSDLTPEEFAAQYLTLKTPVLTGTYVPTLAEPTNSGTSTRQVEAEVEANYEAPAQHSARALPASIDWQTLGAVTSIKDQAQCGCCWAFSATAAIEAINKINGAKLTDFSNQQVLDCTGSDSTCNGGYFDKAMKAVVTSGIANLTAYPAYSQAKYASCRYSASQKAGSVRAVSYPQRNSEDGLAAQLQVQPVVVSFDASGQGFQNYKSGIYTSTTCSSTTTNHAMLLIGYGVNSTTGAQWWRIKNQWGTSWGEAGFLRVARGSNMCGVASYSAYPTLAIPPTTFYAFNDSFVNGWTFSTSGSVTSVNQASTTAVKGTSLSASVAPGGLLVATLPQGSLGYRYFYYSIRATTSGARTQVYVYYGGGAYTWTSFSLSANTWSSKSFDLSTPQSISQVVFNNTGTATTTFNIDELYFQ